jgi:hypothetical protein
MIMKCGLRRANHVNIYLLSNNRLQPDPHYSIWPLYPSRFKTFTRAASKAQISLMEREQNEVVAKLALFA